MNKKINSVLKEVLDEIKPSEETLNYMNEELNSFLIQIKSRISKLNLKVEPFVGGSFAKDTIIKKGNYDVDLFLRFDKIYPEKDFKKLTKKILKKTKKVTIIHGSREYFQVKVDPSFKIEVVPVRKVKTPKESENITDLSYSHVKYVKSKSKNKKILDEIKLAKAFCHATQTYGAESYVHGFSGYSLELLIIKYKTLEKMLKELSKRTKEKIIIDIEKKYKNKNQILMELNGSKLISPIVLIDPTFKERNALAALSNETFDNFKLKAKEFLKKPTKEFFFPHKLNLDELKAKALQQKNEFVFIKLKTKKPAGDVAGTKLLKFFNHLSYELNRYYEVRDSGFKYTKDQEGKCYFVLDKKKEIIFSGPQVSDTKNVEKFKNGHSITYIEKDKIYASEKVNFSAHEFLNIWKKKNKRKIKEMYISKISII